jgi:ACS family hexuronate transporter-like MFS transporter
MDASRQARDQVGTANDKSGAARLDKGEDVVAIPLESQPPILNADAVADSKGVGGFRWVICWLLFAATAFNYIDRQMIGVLKPTLQHDLGWTETAYADIVFWFQAAYALSYLAFGRFIDKVGAKIGYAVAFSIWTLGHMGHALARTALQFTIARMVLGVGEGGSFPGSLKAVAEWFPKRERAFAIGLLNAGSNVGAIVTPLIVPIITFTLGWRWAFVLTGLGSFFWLAAWLMLYRSPRRNPKVSAAEAAYIESDPAEPATPVSWLRLLKTKETWAYALGRFLIDPIWWMFLFWLPDFLAKRHHLDLKSYGPPLIAVYVISDIGSLSGGWFSSMLMKRGWSTNAARKTAMLIAALAVLPVGLAASVDSLWLAVALVALAAAAHQWFSCNLYAFTSDVFPRRAVASVAGIGGTAGAIGGMLMAQYVGAILQRVGDYKPIFIVAAFSYVAALAAIQILAPRYAMANVASVNP